MAIVAVVLGGLGFILPPSIAVGFPLAIATWALAGRDLRSMRLGTMDRTGELLTRSARGEALSAIVLNLGPALIAGGALVALAVLGWR